MARWGEGELGVIDKEPPELAFLTARKLQRNVFKGLVIDACLSFQLVTCCYFLPYTYSISQFLCRKFFIFLRFGNLLVREVDKEAQYATINTGQHVQQPQILYEPLLWST
jgi:hypothetical protein